MKASNGYAYVIYRHQDATELIAFFLISFQSSILYNMKTAGVGKMY